MNNFRDFKRQFDWASNHYRSEFKKNFNVKEIKQRTWSSLKTGHRYLSSTRPYRVGKWSLALALMGRLGYVYGTKFEKPITVTRTFNRIAEKNGKPQNEYLVSDQKHDLYKVQSSFWYWQWFPTELWTKFKSGDSYLVKGYGIRIKALGVHPIIIRSYPLPK